MSEITYPMIIRPLSKEEGGGFLAEFPDLPGCMADGETIEEAIVQAHDALDSWLATAKLHGDPIPSSSSNYSGQWRMRVPKSLHAALALRAKQEGVSLNMLAATLLAEGLGHRETHS
ncbi:MAG: hypothetical protein K0R12_98 [Gammaproteobacteria bacterium]|jgi:antitoxin HicB|nr:hypothetical protein [Gammaproteobacteria bacterium]